MNYTKQDPVSVWSRFWRCVKGECKLKKYGETKKKKKIRTQSEGLESEVDGF